MRTRLLTTGLLILSLTACSKDKQAESTPTTPQTPANTGTQVPPAPKAPQTQQPPTETKTHAAGPVPRTRPPAEKPGAWQQKALNGQDLYATLETNQGDIVVKLFSKDAPLTVANFVGLATGEQTWTDPRTNETKQNTPLYQNVIFHRVIPGFMIQGGDPLGIGSGQPGYTFEDEFQSGRAFDKVGLLAMANRGAETNGSQFFITTSTPQHLNNRHTIFGEVVKGYEVVEKISQVPTGDRNKPVQDVVLKKVAVSDAQPK